MKFINPSTRFAFLAALAFSIPGAAAQAQDDTVSVADRGCHADNATASGARDLDGGFTEDTAMTVTMCLEYCFAEGYRFAGLQAGTECHCGTDYGRFDGNAVCDTPCAGDASQQCGGSAANHVYEFLTGNAPDAASQSPTVPKTPTGAPDRIERTAAVIAVGKWPEGLAHDGESLWVAESGARRVARLDPETRTVAERIRVGRLPVGMAASPDGEIFAAVATDKTIWRSGNGGGTLAQLQDYPQAIAASPNAIHVLTWIGGSSSKTAVVRIDRTTGEKTRSPVLPKNGFDIAATDATIWTLHRLDGENRSQLVGLDADTLIVTHQTTFDGYAYMLSTSEDGLFAAGGEYGVSGLIVAFDPATGVERRRNSDIGFLSALTADSGHVVAIDRAGEIAVFSTDLGLLRTITTSFGGFEPRSVLLVENDIYVSTHRGAGENGSVLAIDDWTP